MQALVHIGAPKTGTTSAQRFLSANRASLADQGIIVGTGLGDPVHTKLAIYALDEHVSDSLAAQEGVDDPTARLDLRRSVDDAIDADIARGEAIGATTWITSCEHLFSRVRSTDEIERLAELLNRRFESATIVCWVRPQLEVAVSRASNISRDGYRVTLDSFRRITRGDPLYDYAETLGRWADVFGDDNMIVVPHRRSPDTISWFVEHLSLTPPLEIPPRANEALDVRTMAVTNALRIDQRGALPWIRHLRDEPATQRLQLPQSTADDLQRRFRSSNDALCIRFPHLELDDLEVSTDDLDRAGNMAILHSIDHVAPQLQRLARGLHSDAVVERAHRHLAEAHAAALTGRTTAAMVAITTAREAADEVDTLGVAESARIRARADQLQELLARGRRFKAVAALRRVGTALSGSVTATRSSVAATRSSTSQDDRS